MLDEGTGETTANERCHRKSDCVNAPLNQCLGFSVSSDINIQHSYLSTQTEVIIENTLLMFSDPWTISASS